MKPTMVEIPESKDIVVGVGDNDSAQRNQAGSGTGVLEQGGQLINSRYPVMKLDEEGKASGQVYPQRSKKWAKSGDQNVLEIHEDGALPTFDDEEVVGIITMEDLIEELLQVRACNSLEQIPVNQNTLAYHVHLNLHIVS